MQSYFNIEAIIATQRANREAAYAQAAASITNETDRAVIEAQKACWPAQEVLFRVLGKMINEGRDADFIATVMGSAIGATVASVLGAVPEDDIDRRLGAIINRTVRMIAGVRPVENARLVRNAGRTGAAGRA